MKLSVSTVTRPPFKFTKKLVSLLLLSVSVSDVLTLNCLGGLTVGDPVLRSGEPLSVELGPGMWHMAFYIRVYPSLLLTNVDIS